MHTPGAEVSGFICVLIVQVTFIVIYGIFVRYDDALLPDNVDANADYLAGVERERRVSYPRKFFSPFPLPPLPLHVREHVGKGVGWEIAIHFSTNFVIIILIINC